MENLSTLAPIEWIYYSDSEYELLLLIQIPASYKLNSITIEAFTLAEWHVNRNH